MQTLKLNRGSKGINQDAAADYLCDTQQNYASREKEREKMSVTQAKAACAFTGRTGHKMVVPACVENAPISTECLFKTTAAHGEATSTHSVTRSGSPRETMAAASTSKRSCKRHAPHHQATESVRYLPSPLKS